MRAQLLHLSGPQRGRTITYAQPKLTLGVGAQADIRFLEGGVVLERHAELELVEEGCSFYVRAIKGKVFVNRQEVREVILEPGDLLEIGAGGPKLRFRVDHSDGKPCKPVRQMLADAREVTDESGLLAGTRSIRHDLMKLVSWRDRLAVVAALIVVLLGVAYLGGAIGSTQTARREASQRAMQAEQFDRALSALRAQVDVVQKKQASHASREEVEKLRADLADRARVVDELVERDEALRQVLDVYSRGVCLVHGRFTLFVDQQGQSVPIVGSDGLPLELEYVGSGFLASDDGYVVTNRHVAEPWWNNAAVEPLIAQGLTPGFTHLTATFPGQAPAVVDASTIRLGSDGVDVAVFKVDAGDAPVLPLASDDAEVERGGRVVVLGYPTGLTAMLARAEPDVAADVLATATDTEGLIAELALRQAISPVITQGALNEVIPHKLVYDAETTSGGSGGPVFGARGVVIGVNFAITADFDGSNFGVPISLAAALLP